MLYNVLVSLDVLIAAGLIGLVLSHQGTGASIGAAFGSGASSTVFGSRGSSSFFTRVITILAAVFFINSIVLAYLASNRPVAESIMETGAPAVEEKVVDKEVIDTITEQINKQIEQNADQLDSGLPADVPGLENESNIAEDVVNNVEDNVQQIQDQVEDTIESKQEEIQSLPSDVPQ